MSRFFAVGLLVCWLNLTAMGIPPTITNNRTTYEIPDGGTVNISCKVTGHPKPSIIWEIDGTDVNKLANSEPFNFTVSENDTLDIRNPRRNKAYGLFSVTCIAENTNGTARKTFNVTIFKAPWITNNKDTYDVPEGGSRKINLNCDTGGFPSPLVNWSIKGNILSEARSYFDNNTKPFNVTVWKNRTLQILPWRKNDGFGVNVTCIADNNIHKQSSKVFVVRFLRVPRILTPSKKIPILEYENSTLNFDCVTTGYPKPEIEWKFGGNVLNATHNSFTGPYVIHVMNKKNVLVQSSYTLLGNGRLTITNPLAKENVPHENFTCVARNIAGQDSRSFELYIGERISHTFEILLSEEDFTENKENISKKIRDSLLVVKPYSVNITSVNSTLRTVNFEILWRKEDLMRGREAFKVQEIAVNVEEALENGGIGLLNLVMNGKPGPPTDLTVNDRTSSEITFGWNHPKHFIVDRYHIQRKKDSGEWINIGDIDGAKKSFKLDDLDSDKKYLIQMFGVRGGEKGEYSENLVASTKASVPTVVIVVVVLIVFFVLVVLLLGYVYYRQRRKPETPEQNLYDALPGVNVSNIYTLDGLTYCPTGNYDGSNEVKYFSWIEILRDDLDMGDVLGEGEFGLVVKAIWTDRETKRETPVAVKTVKGNVTETDRKELFKELQLMADVPKHPNVVNLVGACCSGGPLCVVVEFCENGNLLSYLRKNRTETSPGSFVTSLDLLIRVRIAHDVSKGMRHLEERKIVHRDLAARNVLLGKNKIGKVSDFGLSRDVYEVGLYEKKTGGKLPVKWMAIESLQEAVYSTKSDVWSFGVLFWEIESAGMVPYPGIGGRDILGYLTSGFRLAQQADTPPEIFEMMKICWDPDAENRPPFSELQTKLESFLEEHAGYLPVMVDDSADGETEAAYVNYTVGIDDEETLTTSC